MGLSPACFGVFPVLCGYPLRLTRAPEITSHITKLSTRSQPATNEQADACLSLSSTISQTRELLLFFTDITTPSSFVMITITAMVAVALFFLLLLNPKKPRRRGQGAKYVQSIQPLVERREESPEDHLGRGQHWWRARQRALAIHGLFADFIHDGRARRVSVHAEAALKVAHGSAHADIGIPVAGEVLQRYDAEPLLVEASEWR